MMSGGYSVMANIWLKAMPRPVRRNCSSMSRCLFFSLACSTLVAPPFVGPARQRLAEVAGEDHVGDFVRQHRVEDPLARALDRHPPAEDFAAVEDERGGPAGAEVRADLDGHHARLRPVGHRLAQPRDGQVAAIVFGRLGNLLGETGVGRLDDEVGRPLPRAHRHQQQHYQQTRVWRQSRPGVPTGTVPFSPTTARGGARENWDSPPVCGGRKKDRIAASVHALPRFPNNSGTIWATSLWRVAPRLARQVDRRTANRDGL